ncbi:nucleoside diphosphate kinase regulator [Croceicoccus sp. F390]|uniref:Nucleoside diphosphate kinase regulator n=1 Tax=Croceicoccus esteveae TaxID=3075597 RepID=A0ABU2ZGR4_9SPHN|nr:nucleoside diphosphate kinase regulator [Croceicoccus sp. F390]MDT0575268.1 nucleoside diphosphate kinase regulator [Croceicoccus sp. F390]
MSQSDPRPAVHLVDTEADILSELAMSVEERLPEVAAMLSQEINRATLHKQGSIPADIVTMMATVEFVDDNSNATRTVQLVYPRNADIQQGRISILTLVGAGLIGMREGAIIEWPDRNARTRKLRIGKVMQPDAAAADVQPA